MIYRKHSSILYLASSFLASWSAKYIEDQYWEKHDKIKKLQENGKNFCMISALL